MVRASDFHEGKSGAIISCAWVNVLDREPVNLGNIGFRNSISAIPYEFGEVLYDVRLIGDFNRLLFVRGADKRVGCHGLKKRADLTVGPRVRFLFLYSLTQSGISLFEIQIQNVLCQ